MNFKIENRNLNLRNYPSVERHLEDMAASGWMIDRVILENIFIYKKLEPKQLDFSIVPYQMESFFNRKSKDEIEDYKDENLDKGWNYAAKTRNLQIYFKKKDTQAQDIISSEIEEFRRIEEASKFVKLGNYIFLPLILYLFWRMGKDISTNISVVKSGLLQLVIVVFPFLIISNIGELISIELFLNKNRKHIYEEEKLEFTSSKYYFSKITFIITYIFIFLFLVYIIYTTVFLKDTRALLSILPVTIGLIVGAGLRFFGKSSKINPDYKPIIFVAAIVLTLIAVNIIVFPIIFEPTSSDEVNEDKYNVMRVNDFFDGVETESSELSNDLSLLVPKSYEYTEMADRIAYLRTEYSKALNEDIAKNLVSRYKYQAEERIDRWQDYSLEDYYDGGFPTYPKEQGIREDELKALKDKHENIEDFKREAKSIIKKRMISKADNSLWNVDEAYYLEYEKNAILLRRGDEVWSLGGIDFSDEEIREIVREKLKLN